MGYTYLASPYSHKSAKVRKYRFETIVDIAAKLLAQGETVFCPIAHTYPIELSDYLPEDKKYDGTFWLKHDYELLDKAKRLVVVKMKGWEKSKGIFGEIAYAKFKNIPIYYLDPDTMNYD